MAKVAIVYWSGTGNTEKMASQIEGFVGEAGGTSKVFTADSFNSDMLEQYDAFAFGCPASGDEELEESEFVPMWEGVKGNLGEKKVGLFGSYGWGGGPFMDTWKEDCEGSSINVVGTVICEGEPDDDAAQELNEIAKALI